MPITEGDEEDYDQDMSAGVTDIPDDSVTVKYFVEGEQVCIDIYWFGYI